MKKYALLLSSITMFSLVMAKFYYLKQRYCYLCLSEGYDSLISAPGYWINNFLPGFPGLF
jgi:hypothetical protein